MRTAAGKGSTFGIAAMTVHPAARRPAAIEPQAIELNLDGLVGPTHHHGGLGLGNLASMRHRHEVANPRAAALEGLAKMRLLVGLGLTQGVLPPQLRPDVAGLRRVGFSGDDAAVLAAAARGAPELLSAAASTSSMWAANAATVSPAADTADGRLHLTPANLVTQWHRALETPDTAAVLRSIFPASEHFAHHCPLPSALGFADEGAANQLRLTRAHGRRGLEVFTFGRETAAQPAGSRHPARQTRAASEAVARLHGLAASHVLFLRQNPAAIDAGVFHNDVIAVANEHLLLSHERAWEGGPAAIACIRDRYRDACGGELTVIAVSEAEVPLDVAVRTYLFNSQLVSLPGRAAADAAETGPQMALICPTECLEDANTGRWLDRLLADENPVVAVHAVNVRQSMRNGGGPACLRLRVVLTPEQLRAIHPGVLVDSDRITLLENWVRRHYRDRLTPADLADPSLLEECRTALDELTNLLGLGPVHGFQR
jgi:succinylarginine dihydrolase